MLCLIGIICALFATRFLFRPRHLSVINETTSGRQVPYRKTNVSTAGGLSSTALQPTPNLYTLKPSCSSSFSLCCQYPASTYPDETDVNVKAKSATDRRKASRQRNERVIRREGYRVTEVCRLYNPYDANDSAEQTLSCCSPAALLTVSNYQSASDLCRHCPHLIFCLALSQPGTPLDSSTDSIISTYSWK